MHKLKRHELRQRSRPIKHITFTKNGTKPHEVRPISVNTGKRRTGQLRAATLRILIVPLKDLTVASIEVQRMPRQKEARNIIFDE